MELTKLIEDKLGLSEGEIISFLKTAPNKYKVYFIPKRSSGRRLIAHPSKELKRYQRVISEYLQENIELHSAALAYRKGLSIKDNAVMHKDNAYFLKMDFQNFFNSIDPELFFNILNLKSISLTDQDKYILEKTLFWNPSKKAGGKLVLSVGAPSSPFISNFVMCFFDQEIYTFCSANDVLYTRYADDLTFSTNIKNVLFDFPPIVRGVLVKKTEGKIFINEGKTVFSSRKHNRHVTGITITNDGAVSVGRKRKRYISSLIHRYSLGKLDKDDISYLQGLFSFACYIEKEFKARMIKKYSFQVVSRLIEEKYFEEDE